MLTIKFYHFLNILVVILLSFYGYNCIDSKHENKTKTTTTLTWKTNLNYQKTFQFMQNLENNYPNLIQLISLGRSVQNNDIWLLRISTEQQSKSGKQPKIKNHENLFKYYDQSRTILRPTIKLLSTIHGNEPLGKQLLLSLAEYLVIGYEHHQDKRIRQILNTINIEIVPIINPDGFSIAIEGDCSGIRSPGHRWNGRENANNIDLDQNFFINLNDDDNGLQFKHQQQQQIQPETLAIMTWIISNPSFILSANIHSGLNVIAYPYYFKNQTTLDDKIFENISKNYINSLRNSTEFLTSDSCLQSKHFRNGYTHGYEINPIDYQQNDDPEQQSGQLGQPGQQPQYTMSEFNYINTNCLEIDLYLSCCKYPNSSQLETEWLNNRESLLKFIETAHWGIKGLILDESTQQPIKSAIISIDNINGHNITSSLNGEYWRILLPGIYQITVSAFGYQTKTSKIIVNNLNPTSATILNFTLQRNNQTKSSSSSIEIEDFQFNKTELLPDFHTETKFIHHNYIEMEKLLKEFHQNYSHITRLYSIGRTVEKRKLYVLEISDNPGQHEIGEPEFKYIANMHGNEVVGREMILLFAKLLLENYGHHNYIDWLINNTRIHLMPSMNPDGYEQSNLGDCDSLIGRNNANNVDLNRNFPDQYRLYKENRRQELETLAVMNWLRQYPFVLSANLHGGALVANYPFDGNNYTNNGYHDGYNGTPDDQLFRYLALIYSKNHPNMHKGHCFKKCVDNELTNEYYPNGIINGADWYVLYGGMQDWNYLHTNCFEITIELGCQKYPPANELRRLWQENRRPMLIFIQQVHHGIKGVISDSKTNQSIIDAEIHINSSTHIVKSVQPYGDYWRLLLPGTYQITVRKSGYQSKSHTITLMNNTNDNDHLVMKTAMIINFSLEPLSYYHQQQTTDSFVIITVILLLIFSIIFFTFCMSIVWCPTIILRLMNRTRLFNLCFDCDPRKLFTITTTSSSSNNNHNNHHYNNKTNTFYYSKLNNIQDLIDDTDDDDDEIIMMNR
ncbi:carboxypeptidase D-like [Dermatophagoides pteronyssinus]|uniref:carboxypeptidase D-like n=1 Tax=Dermatophagoides pteronyssinus TaxID=6956 RepID=UPI003F670969